MLPISALPVQPLPLPGPCGNGAITAVRQAWPHDWPGPIIPLTPHLGCCVCGRGLKDNMRSEKCCVFCPTPTLQGGPSTPPRTVSPLVAADKAIRPGLVQVQLPPTVPTASSSRPVGAPYREPSAQAVSVPVQVVAAPTDVPMAAPATQPMPVEPTAAIPSTPSFLAPAPGSAVQAALLRRIEDVVSEIEREMDEPLDELEHAGVMGPKGTVAPSALPVDSFGESTLGWLDQRLQVVEQRREASAARQALLGELRRILAKGIGQGWGGDSCASGGGRSFAGGSGSPSAFSTAGTSEGEAPDLEARLRELEAACECERRAAAEARRGHAAAERDLEALGRHSQQVLEDCHALQARITQLEEERQKQRPPQEVEGSRHSPAEEPRWEELEDLLQQEELLRQELVEQEERGEVRAAEAARLEGDLAELHHQHLTSEQETAHAFAEALEVAAEQHGAERSQLEAELRHALSTAAEDQRALASAHAALLALEAASEGHRGESRAQLEALRCEFADAASGHGQRLEVAEQAAERHSLRAAQLKDLHAGAIAREELHATCFAELQSRYAQLEANEQHSATHLAQLQDRHAQLEANEQHHATCAAELEGRHHRLEASEQHHACRMAELQDRHSRLEANEQRQATRIAELEGLHARLEASEQHCATLVADMQELRAQIEASEQHHATHVAELRDHHVRLEVSEQHWAAHASGLQDRHMRLEVSEQHHAERAAELQRVETSGEHHAMHMTELQDRHAQLKASEQHWAAHASELHDRHARLEAREQQHASRLAEMESLHTHLEARERHSVARLTELEGLHTRAEAGERAALERHQAGEGRLQELEQRLLEAEEAQLQRELEDARRLQAAEAEREELEHQLTEAEAVGREQGQRHRCLQDAVVGLEAQLAEAQSGLGAEGARTEAALRAEVAELEQLLAEERAQRELGSQGHMTLSKRTQDLEEQLLIEARERAEMLNRIVELERELAASRAKEEELGQNLVAAAAASAEQIVLLEGLAAQEREAREAAEGLLQERQALATGLETQVSELQAQVQQERRSLAELRDELQTAHERYEELQRDTEEALQAADKARDARERQIQQLRERVREQPSPRPASSAGPEAGSQGASLSPRLLGTPRQRHARRQRGRATAPTTDVAESAAPNLCSRAMAPIVDAVAASGKAVVATMSSAEPVAGMARPSLYGFELPAQTPPTPRGSSSSALAEPVLPAWAHPGAQPLDHRPDVSGIPAGYLQVLERIETEGWKTVTWKGGYTMLHWAAAKGLSDLCRYLVGLRADITARDEFDKTPLYYAGQTGGRRTSQILEALALVAEAPPEGSTHSGSGRPGSVHLSSGLKASSSASDSDVQDLSTFRESITDLGAARDMGLMQRDTAETDRSVDQQEKSLKQGNARTVPKLLVGEAMEGRIGVRPSVLPTGTLGGGGRKGSIPPLFVEVMRKVDDVGWDKMQWAHGFTLLHWAAQHDDARLCARFLALRADPSQRDDSGRSAFDFAREHNSTAALAELARPAASASRRPSPASIADSVSLRGPLALAA